MLFFKFAFKQSEKGIGRTFLYALLLSFIFSVSILVVLVKGINDLKTDGLNDLNKDLQCEIINYKLICNQNYYHNDDFIIDLEYQENSSVVGNDELILTEDKLITHEGSITYKELLPIIGHEGSSFTIDDLEDLIGPMLAVLVAMIFVVSLIGMFIWYLVANMLLAAVMKLLINNIMNTRFNFEQMYKMVMVIILPFVIFNALSRMMFDGVPTGYIQSQVPNMGWLVRIVLDYAIVFGLTYLTVKKGADDGTLNTNVNYDSDY